MGIKELNKTIKRFGDASIFQQIPIEQFKGKRFAIDISIFICGFVMTSQELWFNTMTNFLLSFYKHKINIVVVFDGKHVPKEKLIERESRKSASNAQQKRMESIKAYKEKLLTMCVYDDEIKPIPIKLQETFDELFKRGKAKQVNVEDTEEVIEFVSEKLYSIEQSAEGIKECHKTMTRRLVKYLGIPYIEAYGEAEALASSMAYQGFVDGVISRDTDSLCYGTPILMTDIKRGLASVVKLDDILSSLNFTKPQFIDMCIALQCDYNKRMPKHGMVAVHKAISQYKSLKEWEAAFPEKPFHLLKYKRCQEIFKSYSRKYLSKKCSIKKRKFNEKEITKLFIEAQYTYL